MSKLKKEADVAEEIQAEVQAETQENPAETADKTEVSEGKKLAKETFIEFIRSLIVGVFPTLTDLIATNLIVFIFYAQAQGYSFWNMLVGAELTGTPSAVSAGATALGYGLGAVVSYFCSVLFVFKNKEKGRTVKGVVLFICIEAFAYGFNVFLGWAFRSVVIPALADPLRIAVSYVVVFSLRKFLIFMPDKKKEVSAEVAYEATDNEVVITEESAQEDTDEVQSV